MTDGIFYSQLFMLTLTVGAYLLALWLYRVTRLRLLHPILTSIVILIVFLKATGINYAVYREGTQIIDFLLGLSVVTLGYLLYEQIEYIRGRLTTILTSVFIGSLVGILSVVLVARLFGAQEAIVASLTPKQVTTPIAISIAENSGESPH